MFSEVAEIARVAQRRGQFQQLLKTQVILIVNFTRPHAITYTNWNLEMLVFAEGGKLEHPEKNPQSRDENQQQTQPTYDAETGNRTRAALVGGECSYHCN